MGKILITTEIEKNLFDLNQIIQPLQAEIELLYSTNDEEIVRILCTESIDLCFVDYELPHYRLKFLLDLIQTKDLSTTLLITAEPQNYSILHKDYDISRDTILLKPLDKDRTLFQIQRILDDNQICESGQYKPTAQELWRRTKPLLATMYWEETVLYRNSRRIVRYRNLASRALYQSAIAAGIPADDQNLSLPILFVSRSAPDNNSFDNYIGQKNVFENLTLSVIIREHIGYSHYLSDTEHLVIFYPYDMRLSVNQIAHRCYQFIQEMERQFGVSYACIVGSPCRIEDLHDQWLQLCSTARQSRFQAESVYIQDMILRMPQSKPLNYAPVSQWVDLILSGEKERIIDSIQRFFDSNSGNVAFTTDYIVSLVHDIDRYVGIACSQLGFEISNQNIKQSFLNAWHSEENFILWITSLTESCIENRNQNDNQSSAIEQAKIYIKKNLTGNLSRKAIAESVHISQNYLARLFREHLGMSMSEYIMETRIERAKDFLEKTSLNIMEISEKVGFSSSTYFSSCFKKATGCAPQTYRKKTYNNINKKADVFSQ